MNNKYRNGLTYSIIGGMSALSIWLATQNIENEKEIKLDKYLELIKEENKPITLTNNINKIEKTNSKKEKDKLDLISKTGERLSELGFKEVYRKLQAIKISQDNQIRESEVEPNLPLFKARNLTQLILMQKEGNLALKALESEDYITERITEIRDQLPNYAKLIECGGQTKNGEWKRIGIIVDKRKDSEYNMINKFLEDLSQEEIATKISIFNSQPLEERTKAYQRIENARDRLRLLKNQDEKSNAYCELVKALAIFPSQRCELDKNGYYMKID